MARRASSHLSVPTILGIVAVVAVACGIGLWLMNREKEGTKTHASNLPIDDFMARGSVLRDNEYFLTGKVEDRIPSGKGELICLVVENQGKKDRIPVLVPQEAKSVNIERERQYSITVKVEDRGKDRGILVAKTIKSSQ